MTTSLSAISAQNVKQSPTLTRFPWIILFGRTGLFISIQVLFALGYILAGSQTTWMNGAAWWPFVVTIANVICLFGLIRIFRAEGENYWSIFRIHRKTIAGDLLALLATLVVAGPAGYFPNIILAGWLFSDPQQVMEMFILPLPMWAVIASIVVFPLTQGLVELAIYFLYVMPRIQTQGVPRWLAVAIASSGLGLQHFAVPLVFDIRFITWRALMYIPFAVVCGIILQWRPRLLPYMAIVHVLMDASFASMLLSAAY